MTKLLRDPEWHIRRIIVGDKLFEVFNPLFSFLISENVPYQKRQRTIDEQIYMSRYREHASLLTERYGRRSTIEELAAFRNSISSTIHSENNRECIDSAFSDEPGSSDESEGSSSNSDSNTAMNPMRILNRELQSFPDIRESDGSDDESDVTMDYSKEPGPHFRARYIGRKLGRATYQIKQKYEEISFYGNIPKKGVYNITTLMETIPTYEPAYVLIKGLYDGVKRDKRWHDVDVKSPKLYKIIRVQEN